MPVVFWDRKTAAVLSPLIGGVAPAVWLWLSSGAKLEESAIPGVCVWAIRDMLMSYVIALPTLALCRRLGVRRAGSLWLIAALVGYPMGHVLANPVQYAWTPTDADFAQGPHWGVMLTYMALFGLTGLFYAVGRERQPDPSDRSLPMSPELTAASSRSRPTAIGPATRTNDGVRS